LHLGLFDIVNGKWATPASWVGRQRRAAALSAYRLSARPPWPRRADHLVPSAVQTTRLPPISLRARATSPRCRRPPWRRPGSG